jgi:hypothetical protein
METLLPIGALLFDEKIRQSAPSSEPFGIPQTVLRNNKNVKFLHFVEMVCRKKGWLEHIQTILQRI